MRKRWSLNGCKVSLCAVINWAALYVLLVDHNRLHATDVLHAVWYMTSQPVPGFPQIPLDDDVTGSSLLSCCSHDDVILKPLLGFLSLSVLPASAPASVVGRWLLLHPLAGAKYCNQFVCLSVTLSSIIHTGWNIIPAVSSRRQMAPSRPNLHTMVPRRVYIQGMLKFKVEMQGHVIPAHLEFHKKIADPVFPSLRSSKQREFMPEIWNWFCPPVSVHASYSRFRDMERLIVFEYLRWKLTILCWKLELGPCPQLFRVKIKCSVLMMENDLK